MFELPEIELEDYAAIIEEGVRGWLTRYAETSSGRINLQSSGAIIVPEAIVEQVQSVCEHWRVRTQVRAGRPTWSLLLMSGRALPVLAISEVVTALRYFEGR
jgi:hypothetical protein